MGTVTIDQIQALERRAGNTRVDVKVMASDAPAAESISKAITLDRINYELAKRGLPRASMLEPPSVFSTNAQEQIQSVIQLGQAGIAGIAVGGSFLLCLVLGTYFYFGYIPEVKVYSMNDRLLRRSTSKEPRKLEEGVPSDGTWTKVRLPSNATRTQKSHSKFAAITGEVVLASSGLVFQDPVNGQVSSIASPIKKFVVSEDEYITNNTYITSEGVHFITPSIKSSEEELLFF